MRKLLNEIIQCLKLRCFLLLVPLALSISRQTQVFMPSCDWFLKTRNIPRVMLAHFSHVAHEMPNYSIFACGLDFGLTVFIIFIEMRRFWISHYIKLNNWNSLSLNLCSIQMQAHSLYIEWDDSISQSVQRVSFLMKRIDFLFELCTLFLFFFFLWSIWENIPFGRSVDVYGYFSAGMNLLVVDYV